MFKKCFLMASIMLVLSLASCASKDAAVDDSAAHVPVVEVEFPQVQVATEINEIYIPDDDEMSYLLSAYNFLCDMEYGNREVPENYASILYQRDLPNNDYTSLMFRFYLKAMENETMKQQVLDFLADNQPADAFSKSLEKKLKSVKGMAGDSVQYCYNDEEYDEDIDLFWFREIHPFDDEFGMLFPQNNYQVLTYKSDDGNESGKDVWLICGGGTNSLSVRLREVENIPDEQAARDEMNLTFYESKYENWELIDVPLAGTLARSGATKYYMGIGSGPDVIPEIDCAQINGYIWNEKNQKLYTVQYFMNFSQINMNYQARYDMYRYLCFYALTLFCE